MDDEIFEHNRAILCHFDGYSALLLFARFGRTMLVPEPLPQAAQLEAKAPESQVVHDPSRVRDALCRRYGLNPEELVPMERFEAWAQASCGPLRVHLFRIKSFAPPKEQLEAHEGKFRPLSEMRGLPPHELAYAKRVFDILVGGA